MRRAVAMLLVALAVTACTDNGPTPEPPTAAPTTTSPTVPTVSPEEASPSAPRVAVVVAPTPTPLAAAAEEGLELLAASPGAAEEIRYAVADEPVFVEDMVAFFTEEGYDLVCVIGDGAADAVRRVAETSPRTRFCATPARANELPANVLPIDIRVEEIGYLAAVATAAAAPGTTMGIVPSRAPYALNRIETAAEQGLADQGTAADVPVAPSAADVEETTERALELYRGGVSTILALWGVDAEAVLEAAEVEPAPEETTSPSPEPTASPTREPPPRLVIGGPDLAPDASGDAETETEEPEFHERVLAIVEVRPAAAIRVAIERLLTDWSNEPGSIGVAQEAIDVVGTPTSFGRQAAAAIEAAREAIIAGEVTVLP